MREVIKREAVSRGRLCCYSYDGRFNWRDSYLIQHVEIPFTNTLVCAPNIITMFFSTKWHLLSAESNLKCIILIFIYDMTRTSVVHGVGKAFIKTISMCTEKKKTHFLRAVELSASWLRW